MEDRDWINETQDPGWTAYDELDVFSRSTIDTKAFLLSADIRTFLFSLPPLSLGLLGGYHYQEVDFRSFDTQQIGYGSWRSYTGNVSGPTTDYTVEYRFFHIGASFRAHVERMLVLTRRFLYSLCQGRRRGQPYQENAAVAQRGDRHRRHALALFAILFHRHMVRRHHLFKAAHQNEREPGSVLVRQRPGDPGLDDTGRALAGIDVEIEQDTFHMGVGLGCRF